MNEDGADGPIILFDGLCNLCHGAVRFVIRRDPGARFRFAPLDSVTGKRFGGSDRVHPGAPGSLVLVQDGERFERSDAILRIVARLRFPWPVLLLLGIVPRTIRDRAYDLVARNRQRWFGSRPFCPAPKPEWQDRFLD